MAAMRCKQSWDGGVYVDATQRRGKFAALFTPRPPLDAELSLRLSAVSPTLEPDKGTREIGDLAVWSVTSAKPGNGVDLLRDGREDTYWQSDGPQPHLVHISFQKKVFISAICLFTDYKLDESYTPQRLSIRAGSCWSDVREIKVVDLSEPQGWVTIPLTAGSPESFVKANILQMVVVTNHQNGRDTHLRQVRVFGPRADLVAALGHPVSFSTPDFQMYATVR